MFPVNDADVAVTVPCCIVRDGAVTCGVGVGVGVGANGAPVILAFGPAPAEFTARTLKVWVWFDSPVNVCEVMPCAVNHAPLLSCTSYLVIVAPPLLSGGCQVTVTLPVPRVTFKLRGAPGAFIGVVTVSVVNVFAALCHAPDMPGPLAMART